MPKKQVKCPCCHRRLMDANPNVKPKVAIANRVCETQADYYIKCRQCGSEIAVGTDRSPPQESTEYMLSTEHGAYRARDVNPDTAP